MPPDGILPKSGLGLAFAIGFTVFHEMGPRLYPLFPERYTAFFLELSHEFRPPEEERFVAWIEIKGAILGATSTK